MAKNKSAGNYNHIPTEQDGIKFSSKMEAAYYLYLKERKKNKEIKDFTMQETYILTEKFIIVDGKTIYGSDPDYNKIHKATKTKVYPAMKYTPDFNVINLDDSIEIIEVKGIAKTDFEIRKKLFLQLYPEYEKGYKVVSYDTVTDAWYDYYELVKIKKERTKLKAAEDAKKKAEKEAIKKKKAAKNKISTKKSISKKVKSKK